MLQATLADGTLTHTAEYYAATGQMKSITVTGAAGPVHALDYLYDNYGNLEYQSTAYGGTTASESFIYDDLHRLLQSSRSTPSGSAMVNYAYDPSGNLPAAMCLVRQPRGCTLNDRRLATPLQPHVGSMSMSLDGNWSNAKTLR